MLVGVMRFQAAFCFWLLFQVGRSIQPSYSNGRRPQSREVTATASGDTCANPNDQETSTTKTTTIDHDDPNDVEPKATQLWDTNRYQSQHSFVWQYGASLIELIELEQTPKNVARILDLGCGSGELTQELARRFPQSMVHGMDLDAMMIHRAQEQFPHLHFFQRDIRNLSAGEENRKNEVEGDMHDSELLYDVIFSNAALHWIPPQDAGTAVESMASALRPGGQFVAEFGGKGNVKAIVEAVQRAVLELVAEDTESLKPFWYFPSVGEFALLLEQNGIEVQSAMLFDRPTILMEEEDGMANWIKMFGSKFFESVPEEQVEQVLSRAQEILKPRLWDGSQWTADYRRIRVVGRKKL